MPRPFALPGCLCLVLLAFGCEGSDEEPGQPPASGAAGTAGSAGAAGRAGAGAGGAGLAGSNLSGASGHAGTQSGVGGLAGGGSAGTPQGGAGPGGAAGQGEAGSAGVGGTSAAGTGAAGTGASGMSGASGSSAQGGAAGMQAGGSGGGSPTVCPPLVHTVVPLMNDVAVPCVDVNVFDLDLPSSGAVLAKVNLVLRGESSLLGVQGWSADSSIGVDDGAQISFGVGEDLCAGEVLTRSFLLYGKVSPEAHRLVVPMHAYTSDTCVAGVTVAAGSSVELWAEDAACAGQRLVARSYFRTQWAAHGDSGNHPSNMTTSLIDLLAVPIVSVTTQSYRAYGQVEISPLSTQNGCGNRIQTASAFVGLDGSYVGADEQGYAPSQGETHVLLAPSASFDARPAGSYLFTLSAAVNQTEQVGAPAGDTHSGDSVLAVLIE